MQSGAQRARKAHDAGYPGHLESERLMLQETGAPRARGAYAAGYQSPRVRKAGADGSQRHLGSEGLMQ